MKKFSLTLILIISFAMAWAQSPNVVVILADDIGLGDISFYRKQHQGKIVVETPNIDKLANQSIVFTDAHSPAALCAPSRYCMMTGNCTFRSDKPWGVWGAYEKSPIKETDMTLGKLMKQAGYNTAFFGKWHLGGDWKRKSKPSQVYRGSRGKPELDIDITKRIGGGPLNNGFDYGFTYPSGIQDVPYSVYENGVWYPLKKDSKIGFISKEAMLKKNVKLDKSEGLGDLNWDAHDMGPLLVNKAVDFINRKAKEKKPFFMYYCSQAVHLPHTAAKQLNGVDVQGKTASKHLDMVWELDVQMGMLVDALKKNGVFDNTLFVFTSDNGGLLRKESLKTGHKSSDIYRGGKNQIYEGGHRVPFIVSWPNKIKKQRWSAEPILASDVLATLAAITDQKVGKKQAMDSHNLLPIVLDKPKAKGHKFMLIQGGTKKQAAYREGDWKLVVQFEKKDKTDSKRSPVELYNLKDNPTEKRKQNLINSPEHKKRVKDMFEKFNSVRDDNSRTTSR